MSRLVDWLRRTFRATATARSRKLHWQPRLETLEERATPVVGAYGFPEAVTDFSLVYNGVVQIQDPSGGVGSGTLLSDGRHILTAAHVVDQDVDTNGDGNPDRGNGAVDAGTYTIFFDVPGGRIGVPVAGSATTIHLPPGWDGVAQNGRDIAVIDLPVLAPYGTQRFLRYGGQLDDALIQIVGYGRTNMTNPDGSAQKGDAGADGSVPLLSRPKRIGYNIVDDVVHKGGDSPQNEYLAYSFDSSNIDRAAYRGQESRAAKGDSGGPVLVNGLIAGVTSYGDSSFDFGSDSYATRVAPFGAWIDGFVDQPYDLVLDLTTQPGGLDANGDTVRVWLSGDGLSIEVTVNNNVVQREFAGNVRSIRLLGSGADDNFIIHGKLAPRVTVDGRAGTDTVTIEDYQHAPTTTTTYAVANSRVTRSGPNQPTLTVDYFNTERLALNTGSGTTVVTGSGPAVTVKTAHGGGTLTVRAANATANTDYGTNNITVAARNVTVNTTIGTNFITIAAPGATVNGGAGNDYGVLSYGTGFSDALTGTVTFNGGGGYDSLSLDDSANDGLYLFRYSRPSYVVTDYAVTRVNEYYDPYVGSRTLTTTALYSGLEYITITGGETSDSYRVESTPAGMGLRIDGKGGNDRFTLGGLNGLDRIRGTLIANPGADTDTLVVEDRLGKTSAAWTAYDVSAAAVVADGRKIPTAGFEAVTLNASNLPSRITVSGTAAGVPVTVNGGSSDDTIDVTYYSGSAAVQSPLAVNGGGGGDSLWVRDYTPGSKLYTLSAGKVEQFGRPAITYGATETVSVVGGYDTDYFTVRGTAAGVTTNVYGWSGADSVSVWNEASTLDDVRGPLNIYGDPIWSTDQDTLYLSDFGSAAGRDYTLTADSLSAAGVGPIHFEQLVHVGLYAGSGDDRFRLQLHGTPAPYMLDGGAGRDTLDYSAYATDVSVDLAARTATDLTQGVYNFENALGGAGANALAGDAGDNVLVGGPGVNTLDGGAGRDLLIAGAGPATLLGGDEEDLLIAGSTAHDGDTAALLALMAEWTRTDLAYADRVGHLRDGGGLNGATVLDFDTVLTNGNANAILGADALDLFYGSRSRDSHDADEPAGEVFVDLDTAPRAVTVDATELAGSYLFLDHMAYDRSQLLDLELTPGEHFFYTYGGSTVYFNVAANGVVSYDPSLEGVLTGQGTRTLSIHGRQVSVDAAALSGSYLFLDYSTYDQSGPVTLNLLPGQHFFYTYGGSTTYFTVNIDGTVDYDPTLDGVLGGRATDTLRIQGQAVSVDAAALSGSYLFLDYSTYDKSGPVSVNLLPGEHFFYTYGGSTTYFTVNPDGTIDYDAALDGVLEGRGTTALSIHGRTVSVDATTLLGSYLFLDYSTYDKSGPVSVNLLPGEHFFYTYGGSTTYFTVNPDGTIDYDAALEGALSGRGTTALGIQGRQVTIDASALWGSYQSLDYVAFDADTPVTAGLQPGSHFIQGYGGATLWFTVNTDGTVDYDPALDGVLSGRGTATLVVHGRTVTLDASTLAAHSLTLDYASLNAAGQVSVNLLPGQHFFYSYTSDMVWFTVNTDGTVEYDASLDGELTGRGTNLLTVGGHAVTFDLTALGGGIVVLDYYDTYDLGNPRSLSLLTGRHLIYTSAHGYVWFQVLADGTLDYDPSLDGILSGRGTKTLKFRPA